MSQSQDQKYRLQAHSQFGFLQVQPTPTPDEITQFYANEFYSAQYQGFNNSALKEQQADQAFHDAHWRDICAAVERVSGRSIAGQRVLDVGCGWAQALLQFKTRGAQCFGFDPAPEAVEYGKAQGLDIRRAGMDTMDVFPGEHFDVVMLLNVLEHLADPVAVMREIHAKLLRKGGVLVIEVPNDFNAFQKCGQRVHGLHEWWVAPPAHLNYFNADTLRRLLSGTGFEVRHSEGSFPLEMFLLFGDNYVQDRALGRQCHLKRVAFETNLRQLGYEEMLHQFYAALADIGLGRQVMQLAAAK